MASSTGKQHKRKMPPSECPRKKTDRGNKLMDADQEPFKNHRGNFLDERVSNIIMQGNIKIFDPFASAWQTRYGKLYPHRLELYTEPGSDVSELLFMDSIEVVADYVMVKGEPCILLKVKAGECRDTEIVLTNSNETELKKWLTSFKSAYNYTVEFLESIANRAREIYVKSMKADNIDN